MGRVYFPIWLILNLALRLAFANDIWIGVTLCQFRVDTLRGIACFYLTFWEHLTSTMGKTCFMFRVDDSINPGPQNEDIKHRLMSKLLDWCQAWSGLQSEAESPCCPNLGQMARSMRGMQYSIIGSNWLIQAAPETPRKNCPLFLCLICCLDNQIWSLSSSYFCGEWWCRPDPGDGGVMARRHMGP